MNRLATVFFALVLALAPGAAGAGQPELEFASGREIMQRAHERHQLYPHVYEEQVMVLVDPQGHRNTRRLRRYTRVEDDGRVRFLLLFDAPREVLGVALLANRDPDGTMQQAFYLPALGPELIESTQASGDGHFLGSDFTVEDLTGENLDEYRYVRRRDERLAGVPYFRVDVHPREPAAGDAEDAPPLRSHYILQDRLFIVRTDHFDAHGRVRRRQSAHDLVPVGGGAWRPNLVRVENLRDGHRSLLRIERRVFSADLVPPAMFSHDWVLANQPPLLDALRIEPEQEEES